MKIKNSVGFPSQGELINFIYKAAGVLPRKYGPQDKMDEKTKKTVQKALARLAAEEGNLNNNFGELIRLLSSSLSDHISNQKIMFSIGEVLFDVLEVYKQVLREDGTYFSKKETMKWFLSTYLISRVDFSVKKHLLRFNVLADNLFCPDADWFLPSIHDDGVEYPLTKAMHWVYELCETSHNNFHYPDKSPSADHVRQEQNLENALNWLNGKGLPSLATLLSNFNFSFDTLEKCEDNKSEKIISEDKRESIRIVLFIARASTFIFKEILENYGITYLKEVCDQYRRYAGYLSEEIEPIKAEIESYIISQQLSQLEIDELWYEQIPKFYYQLSNKYICIVKEIETYISSSNTISAAMLDGLIKQHGSWAIISIIDFINRQNSLPFPENFPDYLFKGLELKDGTQVSKKQIEQFGIELKHGQADIYLPWILDWIYGAFYYRMKQYEIAYPFFRSAFEAAKYCAGNYQYKLVNQYVELAAKNNKWSEFKKVIEWSQFLGIEIRLLRKKEPTKKNLEFVFHMLKTANYGAF
jgi:hypothetical protein